VNSLVGCDVLGEPVETFIQTITSYGTSGLDEPGSSSDGVEAKLIGDLWAGESAWQVLLVGEHEQYSVLEFFLSEHLVELLAVLFNSVSVVGVDDVDETLSVGVVMSPQKSDLVLTADVPHIEGDVLVLDSLDVEADGWNGVDNLTELELVEDCCLASCVEADHENTHLAGADHTFPDVGEKVSHSWCLIGLSF